MRRVVLIACWLLGCASATAIHARVLDEFEQLEPWKAVASDGVSASLKQVAGVHGKAMCLAYDFNGLSGYAVARRVLPINYPANYAFRLFLRGNGPTNNLEFKLADASGDNVWWVDRPNFQMPAQWTAMTLRKRHVAFAWGPTQDKILRASQTFEMTVSAGKGGGRGEACIDALSFEEQPVPDPHPPAPTATASSTLHGGDAAFAVDGDTKTAWRSPPGRQALTLDLHGLREFGGVTLRWVEGEYASSYTIALSDDGRRWRTVREVREGDGGIDRIALPESEARYLRLSLVSGPGAGYALQDVAIEPLSFADTPNAYLRSIAKDAPRGWFPRGFIGEQPYWTLVGTDGGHGHGLIGEDGSVEFSRGGVSVMPFVVDAGRLVTWADVGASQSLFGGGLPLPQVHWRHPDFTLDVQALGDDSGPGARMLVQYRLTNRSASPRDFVLALATQPYQVNPPSQFLNTAGGFAPIGRIDIDDGMVRVAGDPTSPAHDVFRSIERPDDVFARPLDAGTIAQALSRGVVPGNAHASAVDADHMASGALLYRMRLRSGESRTVTLEAPLGAMASGATGDLSAAGSGRAIRPVVDFDAAQARVAGQWREKLGRVRISVPPQAQHVVDTLHTALANMLISRDGPRLQPGTRSYARAWIRDGAMIDDALLRLGHADVAESFVRWYAHYPFATGKIPCCVDDRGADPVPENDSQGEFVHAVAEVFRYTHDQRFLDDMWPHVAGAVAYMEVLRGSERTEAVRREHPAFHGLMPASISHEGYSAKPMHSYWDDFWSLRGYRDAVAIAAWSGHPHEEAAWTASADEFESDLHASIDTATRAAGIDFLPGSAELGDFDATSSTIALSPGDQLGRLPDSLVRNTFERYWTEFVQRRDGKRAWENYTPYELRTIGSFVRLGWRDRAGAALQYFLADQQPIGWNQWAEVVSRTPRKPFFLGDLPHAWVASDYARSVLDMFAYERDGALMLAGGIPLDWMNGDGVAIVGLRTPFGPLSYSLRQDGGTLRLHVDAGAAPPAGFRFAWPSPSKPGTARIDGRVATWRDGVLEFKAPADVVIDLRGR